MLIKNKQHKCSFIGKGGVTINKSSYYINELFSIRDYPSEYNEDTLLSYIQNLIYDVKNNKNLAKELEESLKEKRLELNLCPDCGERLDSNSYKEHHTELDDHSFETFDYKVCKECGWNNRFD